MTERGIEIISPMNKQHPMDEHNPKLCDLSMKDISRNEENPPLTITDEIKSLVFFDSIGVQFHLWVFLFQLIVHLFLPLFFLVPNKAGQGLRTDFIAFYFNIFQPLLLYTMILSYVFCSSDTYNIIGGAIWLPLVYYLSHKIIIALKYASLSPTEYKKFNETNHNAILSMHYRAQMQLISGWIALEPSVLFFELGAASARMGAKINEIYLRICTKGKEQSSMSQFRYWNAFVRGHDTIDWQSKPAPELQYIEQEKGYCISVYDIVLAVIRRANATADPHISHAYLFGTTVTILVILVSYFPLYYQRSTNEATLIIFYLSSTMISITFGPLFYFILYTSIFEVKRLLRIYYMLHCMIRLTDLMMGTSLSIRKNEVSECDQRIAKSRIDAILSIGKVDIGSIQAKEIPLRELERIASTSTTSSKEGGGYKGIGIDRMLPRATSTTASTTGREDDGEERGDVTIETLSRESFVLGERLARDNGYAMVPRISFEHPQNVIAWVYCRVAIQNFGDRFRHRIDIYVGGTCILAIILMIVSLLNIIMAHDRRAAFGETLFVQSLITVTILIIFILILFQSGAHVNDELNLHKVTLSARELVLLRKKLNHFQRCQHVQSEEAEEQSEYYQSITEVIQQGLEILSINTELKPFKILGMDAQMALVLSICTASITFYSTLITFYANANNVTATSSSTTL